MKTVKNILRENILLPLCLQKSQYIPHRKSKVYGIELKPLQSSIHLIIPSEKPVSKLFKY